MIDKKDYRNNRISVYSNDGEKISVYEGKIYIYFGDTKESCLHFIDENDHHHRIYGNNTIIIDEF